MTKLDRIMDAYATVLLYSANERKAKFREAVAAILNETAPGIRSGKDRRQRWDGPPCGVDRRIGQRRALLTEEERKALLS